MRLLLLASLSLLIFLNTAHPLPVDDSLDSQTLEDEARYWDEEVLEKRELYDYSESVTSEDKPKSPTSSVKPSSDSQSDRSAPNIPCTGISNGFGNGIAAAVCTEQLSQEIQDEFS